MLLYQSQLAWRAITQGSMICAIIVITLASGITAAMLCYSAHHVLSINPLVHKDDQLFMLQTDSWHLREPYYGWATNNMPDALSYRDVTALMRSTIPLRKTAMTKWEGSLLLPTTVMAPIYATARVNTRDYFAMFEATFAYGDVWAASADEQLKNVVVLSTGINNQLFNGQNSVGKTILFEGQIYHIVGVINPQGNLDNRLQNIHEGAYSQTESQLYFPFGLLSERDATNWVNYECPDGQSDNDDNDHQARLKNSCVWINYWVEFSDLTQKKSYEKFIENYINEQKTLGFYPRPLRFALSNGTEKIKINRPSDGYALLSKIGFGFLFVCTINCVALLLTKFLNYAPEAHIRRALGASRSHIFLQHLLESLFIGILGGMVGLVMTYAGLAWLRHIDTNTINSHTLSLSILWQPDEHIVLMTLMISTLAGLVAGIYPAWRCASRPHTHL